MTFIDDIGLFPVKKLHRKRLPEVGVNTHLRFELCINAEKKMTEAYSLIRWDKLNPQLIKVM